MIRQELNPETCKLDEEGSDATEQEKINHCVWGTWLSPFPSRKKLGRYVDPASRIDITDDTLASSLVPVQCASLAPPALGLKREKTEGRKREKFDIYLDVTHTHTPGRSRVNPERQEEEKSGHTTGRRPKTAKGGEGNRRTSGTNRHGETDLTKTAHTPRPHDTVRRGTRGKLGTKWGTSW